MMHYWGSYCDDNDAPTAVWMFDSCKMSYVQLLLPHGTTQLVERDQPPEHMSNADYRTLRKRPSIRQCLPSPPLVLSIELSPCVNAAGSLVHDCATKQWETVRASAFGTNWHQVNRRRGGRRNRPVWVPLQHKSVSAGGGNTGYL